MTNGRKAKYSKASKSSRIEDYLNSIDLMKDTRSNNNRPVVQFGKAELRLDVNHIIENSPTNFIKPGLVTLESLHNEKINRKIGFEGKISAEAKEEVKYDNDDDFFDFSLKPSPLRKNTKYKYFYEA